MKDLLEQTSVIFSWIVAEDEESFDHMVVDGGYVGIFGKFRYDLAAWVFRNVGALGILRCVETNFEVYGCFVQTCLTGRFAGQPDES
jgi:hypothetical protein